MTPDLTKNINAHCFEQIERREKSHIIYSSLERNDGELIAAWVFKRNDQLIISDSQQTIFSLMKVGLSSKKVLDTIDSLLPFGMTNNNGALELITTESTLNEDLLLHTSTQHAISLISHQWHHQPKQKLITKVWSEIRDIPHIQKGFTVTGASGHDIRFAFAYLQGTPRIIQPVAADWNNVHINFSRFYDIRNTGYGKTVLIDDSKNVEDLPEMATMLSELTSVIHLSQLNTFKTELTTLH